MCDPAAWQVGIGVAGEPTASGLKNHLLYFENGAVGSCNYSVSYTCLFSVDTNGVLPLIIIICMYLGIKQFQVFVTPSGLLIRFDRWFAFLIFWQATLKMVAAAIETCW
jgi:hypothetical protein